MRYVSAKEILVLHARIIDRTHGRHGVRDLGLLASLVERPKTAVFGKEQFKTLHDKAAVYFQSIIQYHVFVDGNKRTALASAARFLYLNGYHLTASQKEAVEAALWVATEKPELNEIARWFKKQAKKN